MQSIGSSPGLHILCARYTIMFPFTARTWDSFLKDKRVLGLTSELGTWCLLMPWWHVILVSALSPNPFFFSFFRDFICFPLGLWTRAWQYKIQCHYFLVSLSKNCRCRVNEYLIRVYYSVSKSPDYLNCQFAEEMNLYLF